MKNMMRTSYYGWSMHKGVLAEVEDEEEAMIAAGWIPKPEEPKLAGKRAREEGAQPKVSAAHATRHARAAARLTRHIRPPPTQAKQPRTIAAAAPSHIASANPFALLETEDVPSDCEDAEEARIEAEMAAKAAKEAAEAEAAAAAKAAEEAKAAAEAEAARVAEEAKAAAAEAAAAKKAEAAKARAEAAAAKKAAAAEKAAATRAAKAAAKEAKEAKAEEPKPAGTPVARRTRGASKSFVQTVQDTIDNVVGIVSPMLMGRTTRRAPMQAAPAAAVNRRPSRLRQQ